MEKKGNELTYPGNIILIGFMGSGKTTVGIRLSYRVRKVVEDTDKLIEKAEGRTISQIFAADGEEAFRRKETEMLKELAARKAQRIYSVGGGTPVREENRPLLKKLGTVIYLRAKAETIYDRLKTDTTRPLLQVEDPKGRIEQLLAQRGAAYEETADHIIDVDQKSCEEIVEEILSVLKIK